MKGVPLELVQHTIPIWDDANIVQQALYDMNPKYETIVKEGIDKLFNAEFIYKIKHMKWVSPTVIITKKNGKIWVCVDLKKVTMLTFLFSSSHSPPPYDCLATWIESKDGVHDNIAQLHTNQFPQGSCLENELSKAPRLKISMTC